MELQKLFKGIDERYENIVLFFPLLKINQSKNEVYKNYNLTEISLSVLLFILERMLAESGSVTNGELTHFLQKLMNQRYDISLSYEEADAFRKYIVDDKLRNGGKKFLFPYIGENGENKAIAFDLIRSEEWSTDKNKFRLILSEKGIEMLFKTKEMYSEMQITVTMLYFKQQLEKGSFSAALNAAKELLFQIEQQRKTMKSTEEQIKRNALSFFNQKRLERQFKLSLEQTIEERTQLRDLQSAIEKVKQNYQVGNLSRKEEEAYDTILKIDRLINKSKAQHEILFGEKEDVLMSLTKSFQMLLENVFLKQFNIEREIIDLWVSEKITETKAEQFLRPVMPYHKPKVYNPLTAFDPQTTRRLEEKNQEEAIVLDVKAAEQYKKEHQRKEREKYQRELDVLRIILQPLLTRKEYFISDVLKNLRKESLKKYSALVQETLQDFLTLSIELHRSKYKQFERLALEDLTFATSITRMLVDLCKEETEFLDIEAFEMIATEKRIEFEDGTILTDYVLRRKGEDDHGTF
ncbi:hypothetical protein [Siminovitchia fortis]|uniref:hypothetical protein n=1 Tax=Siminovitchia fortis TaxID=254758 RepID=UPI0011A74F14|nr:hypothetical protein [Siminovitchia fortis]